MILGEEILRIRNIITENELGFKISHEGDICQNYGKKIILSTPTEKAGEINLICYKIATELDSDIENFYNQRDKYCKKNCEDNFFNNENTLYSHGLRVNEPFRRMGFGSILKKEIEKMAKDLGYNYIVSIVDSDNIPSLNLNKKLGYDVHQTNGEIDYLFKKLY